MEGRNPDFPGINIALCITIPLKHFACVLRITIKGENRWRNYLVNKWCNVDMQVQLYYVLSVYCN